MHALTADLARRPADFEFGSELEPWVAVGLALERGDAGETVAEALTVYAAIARELSTAGPALRDAVEAAARARHDAIPIPTQTLSVAIRQLAARMEDATAFALADAVLGALLRSRADLPHLEQGRVIAQRARVRRQLGDIEVAADLYATVERLGRKAHEPELTARARLGQGVLALLRGNLPEADRRFDAAIRGGEAAHCADVAGSAHHGRMVIALKRGDFSGALVHGWRAFRHATTPPEKAEALSNLAAVFSDAGYDRDALRAFGAALDRTPTPRLELAILSGAALSAARLGDRGAVRRYVDRLEAAWQRRDLSYQVADALLCAAEACHLVGDPRAADVHRRGADLATQHGYHELEFRAQALEQRVAQRPAASTTRAASPLSHAAQTVRQELESLGDAYRGAMAGAQP